MGDTRSPSETDRPLVCPWWLIYSFDNPLRRLFQPPERILQGLVAPGDRGLDMGCGMGYFTIPLARLVGESGHVTAVDLQTDMLAGVARRARRSGVAGRIALYLPADPAWSAAGQYDFALAFWMVHEVPDQDDLFRTLRRVLKSGARLLVVEPHLHVRGREFDRSLERACAAGFTEAGRPRVAFSRSVLLR